VYPADGDAGALMKYIVIAIALLFATTEASVLRLFTIKQPLYLHGSDTDPLIEFCDVTFASFHSSPEAEISAIARPFIPPSDGSVKKPADVNLTSLYRIKITVEESAEETPSRLTITVDASAAKVPEGYPFTIEQVTDAAVTCVKLVSRTRPEDEQKRIIKIIPQKK
jgi:hypothetical protein